MYGFLVQAAVADAPQIAATALVHVSVGYTPLGVTVDGGTARTVSALQDVAVQVC